MHSGVIVYEIFPDGCLNGVYSNDHHLTKNKIFNEIARKIDTSEAGEDENNISGQYICSYIDLSNEVYICDLEIKHNNGRYDFSWREKVTKQVKFKGTGWLTKQNQITVSYTD